MAADRLSAPPRPATTGGRYPAVQRYRRGLRTGGCVYRRAHARAPSAWGERVLIWDPLPPPPPGKVRDRLIPILTPQKCLLWAGDFCGLTNFGLRFVADLDTGTELRRGFRC